MNSWVVNDSLDCQFSMTACTTLVGPKISAFDMKDDKFGLKRRTKNGMFESLISINFQNYCLWWMRLCEKNKLFEDDEILKFTSIHYSYLYKRWNPTRFLIDE